MRWCTFRSAGNPWKTERCVRDNRRCGRRSDRTRSRRRFDTLVPEDVIQVHGIGWRAVVTGHPQRYAGPGGAPFHIVEVMFAHTRPTCIVLDADSRASRVPFRASSYELELGAARGGRGLLTASLNGRPAGEVLWRVDDGVVLNLAPSSPHDPLRRFLLSHAAESIRHLRVPDATVPVGIDSR